MIVELKSLLPLIYGGNQEQTAEIPPTVSPEELPEVPVAAESFRAVPVEEIPEVPVAAESFRAVPVEEIPEVPVAAKSFRAVPPEEIPEVPVDVFSGTEGEYRQGQEMTVPEVRQEKPLEMMDNSRVTDLLEQLLAVSEKNAESSEKIADLLDQQTGSSFLTYN